MHWWGWVGMEEGMRKLRWQGLLILLVCLGFSSFAFARGNERHERGDHRERARAEARHERWREARRDDRTRDRAEWRRREEARERYRREQRERWERERRARWQREHERRPPGWDHGRKTGWGDCDVPPGQARKSGCDDRGHRIVRPSPRPHPPVMTAGTQRPAPTPQPAPNQRRGWWEPMTKDKK